MNECRSKVNMYTPARRLISGVIHEPRSVTSDVQARIDLAKGHTLVAWFLTHPGTMILTREGDNQHWLKFHSSNLVNFNGKWFEVYKTTLSLVVYYYEQCQQSQEQPFMSYPYISLDTYNVISKLLMVFEVFRHQYHRLSIHNLSVHVYCAEWVGPFMRHTHPYWYWYSAALTIRYTAHPSLEKEKSLFYI